MYLVLLRGVLLYVGLKGGPCRWRSIRSVGPLAIRTGHWQSELGYFYGALVGPSVVLLVAGALFTFPRTPVVPPMSLCALCVPNTVASSRADADGLPPDGTVAWLVDLGSCHSVTEIIGSSWDG